MCIRDRYYFEELADLPTEVEQAAEYRYRNPIIQPDDMVVAISQSGETADTLAAVREAKQRGALVVGICNVVGSTIAREAGRGVYLHAGPEIGVASTKAFTCQLAVLLMMALKIGRCRRLSRQRGSEICAEIRKIPGLVRSVLQRNDEIIAVAAQYAKAKDFFFLGRGCMYPVALEGALKLKEISYIHAEGYPAGEMKHGPIALIDERLPVVAIAPHDAVFEKMIGNMQEVKARGGSVIALTTRGDGKLKSMLDATTDFVLEVPQAPELLTPIIMTIPLQLLAYDIAVRRGCDVDQPRNLAKSVTVE